jgi:hypothetical protein
MNKILLVSIALVIPLAGCAKSPSSIDPAYVSATSYQSLNCQQLADEDTRVVHALGKASSHQERARTNDVIGVVLIGLPVSTLSGDNIAPQIADLKGQREAIHQASRAKGCK